MRLGFGGNPGNVESEPENYVLNQVALEEGVDYEKDSDGDHLNDNVEIDIKTLPLVPDTDGDSLKDGLEVEGGYDPTNPNPDKDHLNDYEEWTKETNPYVYNKTWTEHSKSFLAGVLAGDIIKDTDDYVPLISDVLKLCYNINPDLIKEIERRTGAISKISDAAKANGIILTKADSEFIDKIASLDKVKITIDMMMEKGLVDITKKYLKDKSFFNSNWSESQVIEVTTEAFNRAIQKGIPSEGSYQDKFEIFGEQINIVFQDGKFKTAYGEYKFKLSDFGY